MNRLTSLQSSRSSQSNNSSSSSSYLVSDSAELINGIGELTPSTIAIVGVTAYLIAGCLVTDYTFLTADSNTIQK